MPIAIAWLGGALALLAAPLVARVLMSLGIGVVSYVGMSVVLDYMWEHATTAFNGLPLAVLQLAALMKLDVAINIIMGSINARLGFISLNGIVNRFAIDPAAYQNV